MSDQRKGLRERAREFSNALPFMEGREKGDISDLHGHVVTIRDFGFLKDNDERTGGDKEYACFIIDEQPSLFFFGGKVLTDNLVALEVEGYHEEIVEDGLPVKFGEKVSKNKMKYTTVDFYPTETEEEPKKRK